jgi:hypothetical protein
MQRLAQPGAGDFVHRNKRRLNQMLGVGNIGAATLDRRDALSPLLVANALLLLVPKLALVVFLDQTLWGGVGPGAAVVVLAQDLLVAIAALALNAWMLRTASIRRALAALLISGLLLILLMMDMRVRELWLKPIDFGLIRYLLDNASGLVSGFSFFFKYAAIYSVTFERFLFFVALAFAAIWTPILWSIASQTSRPPRIWSRRGTGVLLSGAAISLAIALCAPHFRYRINENLLTGRLVALLRSPFVRSDSGEAKLAASFEQPPLPLKSQLGVQRKILGEVPPFKNVIVIVLESVRWKGLDLFGDRTLAPTLSQLTATGLVTKCRVAVPHSAKAYYTVFSGRYPFPGIEMREIVPASNPSIWHSLRDTQQVESIAVSSQNLLFEGMGVLLKSFGIQAFETRSLPEAKGAIIETTSSFGASDKSLYPLGSEHLAHLPGRFAGIFFPLAAHYPYDCPGTTPARHDLTDYRLCIRDSDQNVAGFLASLKKLDRLADTLIVIVGDHGESFGEHGTYVHNSSMYDEEVSVPLIFWSEDGRLGHHVLEDSRQIDIAPTIADLMGALDTDVPVQGVSLLRRDGPKPAFMATFFDDLGAALVEPPYEYIYDQSTEKLSAYNLVDDPMERAPLVLAPSDQESKIVRIKAFLAYQRNSFPRE